MPPLLGFRPPARARPSFIPRVTIGRLMILIAIATAVAWSIAEALRPSYPEGWIIARLTVLDGPIHPPFGNTRAPESEQESHVRRAISDEVLRDARPGRPPEELRRRLHVWCNPPNSLYVSIFSNDPVADRSAIDAVTASYRKLHKASLFHPASLPTSRTYPRALPVLIGLIGLAAAGLLLMASRIVAGRRRRAVAPGQPDPAR